MKGTQLDWGALLYPVGKKDLIALYSEGTELLRPQSSADAEWIRLSELPDDNRYGLVVVECA